MKQASTYLTVEEMAQFDRLATARGVSRAALLHELVAEFLSGRASRPKRVSTFDFGGPVGIEEQRRIVGEAYERRADRR